MARSKINLEPQFLDLVLYAGDGISFQLVVTDTANDPIELTGTMKAEIKVSRLDDDPSVVDFSVDLSDAVNGVAVLSLTGAQTQSLSEGNEPTEKFTGEWDCEWTPLGEEPITLCQGTVECLPDVTN